MVYISCDKLLDVDLHYNQESSAFSFVFLFRFLLQ